MIHYRVQPKYVAVEALGRLKRRTGEIRDHSANTHIVILSIPLRRGTGGRASRPGG
jgi:hypothetical protein